MNFVDTGRSPHLFCPLVMSMYCGKMADLTDRPFGVVGQVGPRNHVFDGHAHWGHLANMVE